MDTAYVPVADACSWYLTVGELTWCLVPPICQVTKLGQPRTPHALPGCLCELMKPRHSNFSLHLQLSTVHILEHYTNLISTLALVGLAKSAYGTLQQQHSSCLCCSQHDRRLQSDAVPLPPCCNPPELQTRRLLLATAATHCTNTSHSKSQSLHGHCQVENKQYVIRASLEVLGRET